MKHKAIVFVGIFLISTFGYASDIKDSQQAKVCSLDMSSIQKKIDMLGTKSHNFEKKKEAKYVVQEEQNEEMRPFGINKHEFCKDLCSRGMVSPPWDAFIRCYIGCMELDI